MKTKILTLLLTVLLFNNNINATSFNDNDPEKDKIIIYVLKNILTRGHYVEKDMDDNFSEYVYNEFINSLDPSKRYFTQEDLKEFSQFKHEIDDQLKDSKIDFYTLVYGRFLEKLDAAKLTYKNLLMQPFDYDKKEEVEVGATPAVIANISYSQVARKKVSWKITFGILIIGIVALSFFLSGNKTRVPKKVNPLADPNIDQSLSNQFDDDYKLAEEIEKANRPKQKVTKRRKKKVIFYERPKIIESKVIGQILPGSMVKAKLVMGGSDGFAKACLLYTSPSPRDS